MHIPDGYLGPPTFITTNCAFVVLMAVASRRLKRSLQYRQIPLLAISSAFSFLVMMFNIPLPGGTTGHITGAALIALAIGPWAAFVSLSIVMIVQALLFGDGGVTAIGANSINIGFLASFGGFYCYQLFRKLIPTKFSKTFAALIAGWFSVNLSAFTTALTFGLQPLLHSDSFGRPLYAPFHLNIALPAMMLSHVFVVGVIEGLVTGLAVYYLEKSNFKWVLNETSS